MPDNRTAIVTGSTSSTGLGIARALTATGYNIMLNGFGDEAEIEAAAACNLPLASVHTDSVRTYRPRMRGC